MAVSNLRAAAIWRRADERNAHVLRHLANRGKDSCEFDARRMTYLSRDAILQREDIKTEDVEVPEWGGTVRVRGMSGVQRDAFRGQPDRAARETNGRGSAEGSRTSSKPTWPTSGPS